MMGSRASLDTPSIEAADRLVRRVVGFQAYLRAQGFRAGIPEAQDALKLADSVDITDRHRFRNGLRSLLCGNQAEWTRFEELFDAYWLPPNRSVLRRSAAAGRDGAAESDRQQKPPKGLITNLRQGTDTGKAADQQDASQGGASDAESAERKDFRHLARDELEEIERLVDRLAARMRRRMVRRQRITSAGRKLHLRRTLRNSLQFGGTPIALSFRSPRRKPPQLVVLLDVSRSMSIYTYILLRFTRAIVRAFKRADAFVFHTQLVSVTEALRERDAGRMRDRLSLLSSGWSGGTRIGESLAEFNNRYSAQLVGRKTTVIIVSDGFDTGEPALLAKEMDRLRSRARRIVWLNPLLGRLNYEPLSGGMAAALPFVDHFATAHNLESLLALEPELVRL